MQITLNQEEILEALKDYAFRVINVAPGNDITIDLKAGRGENGYSATLEITPQRLTESHEPKTPNALPRSSGSTESLVGILRTKDVELAQVNTSVEPTTPEVPVVGEEIIDTSESDDDEVVDGYLASQKTKSLFAQS